MNRVRTIAMFTTILATACSGGGTSRVSVMLKDAPGPFQSAVVTIAEVDLMGEGGKLVLSTTPKTVNLLDLTNEVTPLVSEQPVAKGTYTELRFVISGGYVVLQDGTVHASQGYSVPPGLTVTGTLKMPSFAQSGLKVDTTSDALVITGDTKILLVDFDVSQSFGHEAGNSGSWVMHPVIKGADFTMSGNLVVTAKVGSGVSLLNGVTLASFDAVVSTDPSAPSTQVTISPISIPLVPDVTDPTRFVATFKYLFPGSYQVTFAGVAPATNITLSTSPTTPASVTVVSQQDTTADFTITGSAVAP